MTGPSIRIAVLLAGLAGMLSPTDAAAQTNERSLDEFLAAQGTYDFGPYGVPFLPPVPNFIGWTDPQLGWAISVDYAGLADATCGGIAGTTFRGEVKETPLPDGRALVSVELETANAITFVTDGSDPNDPVLFGEPWINDGGDCLFAEPPALGESELKVSFTIPYPGAPLPDFYALVVKASNIATDLPEDTELVSVQFESVTFGELADGSMGKAETKQVGDGMLNFSVEKIEVE